MHIRVKLFAIIRERAGVAELPLDLPDGANVAAAELALKETFPAIAGFLRQAAYAVNREYVEVATVLKDGDELAVIPPVSGGSAAMSQPSWIELLETPLDAARAVSYVSDVEEAGGVCVFLGTTRAEQSDSGQQLLALDYEAYAEMALKQLQRLAEGAQKRWPVLRVAILHRLGRVSISQASVLIAVACPHRGEAFEACRWIIDTLKKDVAIWKKEVWADGSGTWVHPE